MKAIDEYYDPSVGDVILTYSHHRHRLDDSACRYIGVGKIVKESTRHYIKYVTLCCRDEDGLSESVHDGWDHICKTHHFLQFILSDEEVNSLLMEII